MTLEERVLNIKSELRTLQTLMLEKAKTMETLNAPRHEIRRVHFQASEAKRILDNNFDGHDRDDCNEILIAARIGDKYQIQD